LQRIKLGDTSAITLAAAIAAAAKLKAVIAAGGDPAGERRRAIADRIAARTAEAARATCRELIGLYGASMASRGVTSGHIQDEIGHLTRGLDAVDMLDAPPEEVTAEAVETMMARCPVKSRATRFATLNRFLIWALRRARSDTVPPTAVFARHERPKRGEPRQRVLTLDELKAIWLAAGELSGIEGDLTQFLICVPCRRGEASLMQWRDLDLAGGTWTMPTSKNTTAHRFYLCGLVLDILQKRRRVAGLVPEGDALVFPGPSTGGVFSTWSHLKRHLDARLAARGWSSLLGAMESWILHDLRRSFATIASRELKAADNLIDLVINHAAAKTRNLVTRTYNVNDKRDERVELMRRWNALLVALIEGRTACEAEIIPLHAHTA
jgi:integrase